MHYHKIIIVWTGLLSILARPAKVVAQEIEKDFLPQQIENYSSTHLEEKIFLHTDKTVYLSNEICWFKIYNVDAFFHLPLSISSIAYVEILDNNSKAITQEKVSLQNGLGSGSITLPNNIGSGNYTLRAYTNWMKNYSPNFFFKKTITIINTQQAQEPVSNDAKEDYKIQLFPEGGNLVNGISNKVAFKIFNQYGKGIASKGYVLNELGDTITPVNTLKFGVGKFNFKPLAGHQFKIVLNSPDGRQIAQSFPPAFDQGFSLKIIDPEKQTDSIKVVIECNKSNSSIAYLMGHTRGVVNTFIRVKLKNEIAEYTIAKSKLGDGINTLTLFDEYRNPVCERLYFKYPKSNLDLVINMDSLEFNVRKKVNLKVVSALENGATTSANLSMSVYKIDSLQSIDESNIQNYIWLTSDLTGKVESPNSYFNANDPLRFEAMDNLMLTNGWRRFNWETVLKNQKYSFEYLPEIAGKIITGKVIPNKENLPINGITTYLSMAGKRTQFRSSMSDKNGQLKFQFPDFYNDDQVIAQIEKNNASNYKIEIENPFVKSKDNEKKEFLSYNRDLKLEINRYNRDLQVQNYYNADYTTKFENPVTDTSSFYHKADDTYLLDDYSRFTTLEEVFREYVTPIKLSKSNGNFEISVYDNVQKRYFNNPPLMLLDGYPISDLNKFMEYDPLKIRKIEIVGRMYFLGNTAYNGILNFTTYTGKMEGYELDPQAVVLDFKGLQSQREFSTPEYENQSQLNNRLPDFRHLLYWSDAINTSVDGKKDVSFYTSDVPGKYVIVVQGINNQGKTGYKEITFDVSGH